MRKTFEAVPRLHELYDGGGDEKHYQRRLLAPGRLALENPIETELNSIAAKYYQNLLAVGPLSLKLLIDAAQAQTKAGRTGRSAAAAGLAAWTPAVGKVYGACLRNMKRTVGRLRPFQPEPDTGDASVSEASASDATAAFCPARHALVYHTTRLGHSCDMCRARIAQGARVKRCHECDYDACLACSPPPPPPLGASSGTGTTSTPNALPPPSMLDLGRLPAGQAVENQLEGPDKLSCQVFKLASNGPRMVFAAPGEREVIFRVAGNSSWAVGVTQESQVLSLGNAARTSTDPEVDDKMLNTSFLEGAKTKQGRGGGWVVSRRDGETERERERW